MRWSWRFFLLSLLILGLAHLFFTTLGPVDDAYITCRYAWNLAQTGHIEFNPGERVEGCTAFAMMILLTPFALLKIRGLIVVAQVLGVLAWAAASTLAWGFIRSKYSESISTREYIFGGILIATWMPWAWSWSGMETTLIAAAWLLTLLLHLREQERNLLPIGSALMAVCCGLLRPDGIMIAAVIGISILFPINVQSIKRAAIFSAIVVGLFGSYWLWRWHYFGYPFPNTFYAKVSYGGMKLRNTGLSYLLKGMFNSGIWLLWIFMTPIYLLRKKTAPRWYWLFLGAVLINWAAVIYMGGDFYSFNRFLLPSYIPSVLSLWFMFQSKAKSNLPKQKHFVAATFLLIALNLWSFGFMFYGPLFKFVVTNTTTWQALGEKLRANVPKGSKLATLPIGALGYFSDLTIIDLVGLVDTHIAHRKVPTGRRLVGHEKHDSDYVLDRKPEMIFTWPSLFEYTEDSAKRYSASYIGTSAQSDLLHHSRLKTEYDMVKIKVNRLYAFGYLRKDLIGKPGWTVFQPIDPQMAKILQGF